MKKIKILTFLIFLICQNTLADCYDDIEVSFGFPYFKEFKDDVLFLNNGDKNVVIWDVDFVNKDNKIMKTLEIGLFIPSYNEKRFQLDAGNNFAYRIVDHYQFNCFYWPDDSEFNKKKEIKTEDLPKYRFYRPSS